MTARKRPREGRVSRFLPGDIAETPPKLTAAMKRAAGSGRNAQKISAQTERALEERGLIRRNGRGRWHWTASGRAVVRQHRKGEE